MSPELSLLVEVWDRVKSFVPAKERVYVAEELVRLFDDNVGLDYFDHELDELNSVLKAAFVSHFDIGLDDDEYEDDEY